MYGATQRAAQVVVSQPPPPLSPADLNAVLLAVATIVLGFVAFFVSVIGFIGLGEIRGMVERLAKQ